MNKQLTLATLISFFCIPIFSQIAKDLKLVWSDEFNGSKLDQTKWSHPPAWNRQGGSFWSDENYEMTGKGQLKLSVTERNDSVFCGALRTRNLYDKKYGYFEVRCKVPQMHGGWGAFWLMPYQNLPGSSGNDGTEIDVFESINGWKGQINHAIHWDGYGSAHQKDSYRFSRADLYDDKYHVFGMKWTPDEYIFYIDHQETWRTSAGGVSDVKQYLKLSLEVSGDKWPGDWGQQEEKPIDWLIDYVRVYEHEPNVISDVSLSFRLLQNDEIFNIGDHVQMHVDVESGLNQIDEIKFFTQKSGEPEVLKMIRSVNTESTYWYNWFPDESGSYKLKAKAYKNGEYVTNVVVDATVSNDSDPLALTFKSVNSGQNYEVGNSIDMTVELSGTLEDADELHFLTSNSSGDFVLQQSKNMIGASMYNYDWLPQASGVYSLRVTAKKNGAYVSHVVVGSITVEDALEPLAISFNSLTSGSNFELSDQINMAIDLTGDLSDATDLQFLVKKGDNEFNVKYSTAITDDTFYEYYWQPTELGVYSVRITATKNGAYVTHTVLGAIAVEAVAEPLGITFDTLRSGNIYQLSDDVNMDINLSGDLSQADELQFWVKNGSEAFELKHTAIITSQTLYAYNWQPDASGLYTLRVTALKNGSYVKHVVVGSIQIVEPVKISFTELVAGSVYALDEEVKMDVSLTGDQSIIDELRFIVQKIGESASVLHSAPVTNKSVTNSFGWLASDTGDFKLKVSAYKNGNYVTHVSLKVSVVDPIKLTYRLLEDGQQFEVGDDVKMHVDITGDISQADELKFIIQKADENGIVDKVSALKVDKNTYWNKWVPAEAGTYNLKVKAFKSGIPAAKVIAKITVLDSSAFLRQGESYADFTDMKIYPNPTSGFLFISSDEELSYKVMEVSGKLLKSGKSNQIDLSTFSSGVYFVLIAGEYYRIIKE